MYELPEGASEHYGITPFGPNQKKPTAVSGLYVQATRNTRLGANIPALKCLLCHVWYRNSTSQTVTDDHLKNKHGAVLDAAMAVAVDGAVPAVKSVKKERTYSDAKLAAQRYKDTALRLLVDAFASTGGVAVHAILPDAPKESKDKSHGPWRQLFKHLSGNRFPGPTRKTVNTHARDLVPTYKDFLAAYIKKHGGCEGAIITDLWSSLAKKEFYGIATQWIDQDWNLKALPVAIVRMEKSKAAVNLLPELQAVLDKMSLRYAGCPEGEACPYRSKNHSNASTCHGSHVQVTDNGGSDPTVADKNACNPVRCADHGINLVCIGVEESKNPSPGTTVVLEQFHTAHDVVTHYRKSNKASDALAAKQTDQIAEDSNMGVFDPERGDRAHVLLAYAPHRWMSRFTELSRLFERNVWEAVQALGRTEDMQGTAAAADKLPTVEGERICKDALIVLGQLKTLTVKFQSETEVTSSLVAPYLCQAIIKFEAFSTDQTLHWAVRDYAKDLGLEMQRRLQKNFIRPAHLVATLLDPRFKRLSGIPSRQLRHSCWDHLKTVANLEARHLYAAQPAVVQPDPSDEAGGGGGQHRRRRAEPLGSGEGWQSFIADNDDGLGGVAAVGGGVGAQFNRGGASAVDLELAQWRSEPAWEGANHVPDVKKNPLAFWKTAEANGRYPILCRVARKFLAFPATSAAAERLFSYTGHRVSKKKVKMSDHQLMSWTFLNAVNAFCKKWNIPKPV